MGTSELTGQVALVTGGASGIGLASSKAFAAAGATVVIGDKDKAAAEHAAELIKVQGGRAVPYHVDVSSLAQLRAMFEFVGNNFGTLNVLFSNAGIQGPLGLDVTEEQFDQIIDLNLKSHFFAATYAIPLMKLAAPRASIILTSSTSGLRAGRLSPLYSTTKAAIIMLARSLARQLGPEGMRVNAICPGPVETPFSREYARMAGRDDEAYQKGIIASGREIPLGRVAQSDDVARVVVFLASDASRYITGTSLPVDGGLTA